MIINIGDDDLDRILAIYSESRISHPTTYAQRTDATYALLGLLERSEIRKAKELSEYFIENNCPGILIAWWHFYQGQINMAKYSSVIVTVDRFDALRYLELVLNHPDEPEFGEACFELAIVKLSEGDTDKFCELLENSIETDLYWSLVLYGYCLQGFHGVQGNSVKSISCFDRAKAIKDRCDEEDLINTDLDLPVVIEELLPEDVIKEWFD